MLTFLLMHIGIVIFFVFRLSSSDFAWCMIRIIFCYWNLIILFVSFSEFHSLEEWQLENAKIDKGTFPSFHCPFIFFLVPFYFGFRRAAPDILKDNLLFN